MSTRECRKRPLPAASGPAAIEARKHRQPFGPIPTEFEVVIEILQSGGLEHWNQSVSGITEKGADDDQVPFHPELVWGQFEGGINICTREGRAFKGGAPNAK